MSHLAESKCDRLTFVVIIRIKKDFYLLVGFISKFKKKILSNKVQIWKNQKLKNF